MSGFTPTSVVPANPGWYCVFKDADGVFHTPIVAWAVNEDFQMLPMTYCSGEWVEVDDLPGDIIYSPFEIPRDTGTSEEGAK